jgi:hypothetical protein
MNTVQRIACTCCLVVAAGGANASPFKMPDLAAATSYEVKLQAGFSKASDGEVLEGPALDMTAPLGQGLETSVTAGVGRISHRDWGWLDTEVAAKWELVPIGEEDGHFGFTTEPTLVLPTATQGLGGDEYQLIVPVIGGVNFGKVGLRGLLGLQRGYHLDGNKAQFGALATYEVTDALLVGIEYADESPMKNFSDHSSSADVGVSWNLTPQVALQGRLGHTVRAPAGRAATEAALYLEFAF